MGLYEDMDLQATLGVGRITPDFNDPKAERVAANYTCREFLSAPYPFIERSLALNAFFDTATDLLVDVLPILKCAFKDRFRDPFHKVADHVAYQPVAGRVV